VVDSKSLVIKKLVSLWIGDMENYQKERGEVIQSLVEEKSKITHNYLTDLLIHNQYQYILQQFELGKFKDYLKENFLPLYYVVLKIIDVDNPKLIKMPPEISENVNDIISEIKEIQAFYYGEKEPS
jgi:hypothetical protein